MKTKEKEKKKLGLKITVKQLIILLVSLVVVLYSVQVYFLYFGNSKTYGKEENANNEPVVISNASEVDVDEIINKNAGSNRHEEIEKQEVELEYLTSYRVNNELPKGTVQVIQEGRMGSQEIVIQKVYENEQLVSEEQLSNVDNDENVLKVKEYAKSENTIAIPLCAKIEEELTGLR